MTVWSFISYGLLPLGLIICVFILSGFNFLEKIGRSFCKLEIHIGEMRIRLPLVILLISTVCCLGEYHELTRMANQKQVRLQNLSDIQELWKSQLWRHQRNWWLSLFSMILWGIVWRFSGIISRLRFQLEMLQPKKKL